MLKFRYADCFSQALRIVSVKNGGILLESPTFRGGTRDKCPRRRPRRRLDLVERTLTNSRELVSPLILGKVEDITPRLGFVD